MSDHEHHGMKSLEGLASYCNRGHGQDGSSQREDRFGRMFGSLQPAYTPVDILRTIGKPGGPMDGGKKNEPTDTIPVGLVFFGQFVDHDITLDTSTSFNSNVNNPGEITNVRTPTLDLDCIYGSGPEAQPYLYVQNGDFGGAKLLTGADNSGQAGLAADDLLRSPNARAMIGDPRNDENGILSQLQLAIIRFHNHVCDTLNQEHGYVGNELYEHARQDTTFHYQWAVVNDLLGAMCGKPVVEEILGRGRTHFCGGIPYIPVEFSVAAYRFGHSMIPMSIQVQKGKSKLELFGEQLGRGFKAIKDERSVVDWHELLDTPENRKVERAQKLNTKLAGDLLKLPFIQPPAEASLATRNLLRGNTFLLPAGEAVAEAIDCDPATISKVRNVVTKLAPTLPDYGIPLWLYILAEAEVIGRKEADGSTIPGEALGPVGATIVAETIIGLLELDPHSYLGSNRNWSPREDWNTIGKIATAGSQ